MKNDRYLGMRPGDLEDKAYAKYWQPQMKPLPARATEAILQGPVSSQLGFAHEEAERLLQPGYLPLETGYTRLNNGQIFVAVLTDMPRVSGEMIDWWFAWHSGEKERYKLWHPQAHIHARFEKPLSDVPGLADREKYVGNVSYVDEYIGCEYLPISIAFQAPGENHLDEGEFERAGVSTAVCARIGHASKPLKFGRLIHLIRETESGCEMRSRFWLGEAEVSSLSKRSVINRALESRAIAKRAAKQAAGRDLVVHCAMEMQHLAGYLPDLYRDYHSDGQQPDVHETVDTAQDPATLAPDCVGA